MIKDINRTQNYNTDRFVEEIELVIPFAELAPFMQISLDATVKNTVTPGFRKGHAPKERILQDKNPEIFDKAVNLLVDSAIKQIFNELEPRPAAPLRITNIEPVMDDKQESIQNIKVKFEYIPVPITEVNPDILNKIDIKKEEVLEPSDDEIENEISELWYRYILSKNPEAKKEDYKSELITPEFLLETKITEAVSEITDYSSLKEYFKKALKVNKENNSNTKYIDEIVGFLVNQAKIQKYEGLREREVETRYSNYLSKFKQLGKDPEKYLQEANVDTDQLKSEWRDSIERELKAEFVLIAYANALNFVPSDEEIEKRIEMMDDNTKKYYNKFDNALRVIAEIEIKKSYILNKVTGKEIK